ncbi:hypothetical protein BN6_20480 [Saccharothrix espanaensis DSM 44229]|uniref:Uncharacterized protein n=1 Tax=Saccharothrix espanaensis (strain ATCC 51144 / DSM 44229 / JCM 9112 / NBRC 15066 / NRRL 15764) TaxID=1179773 RepID=K0JQ17_SACES|nr:hypothetical protein BN6_20480 [Saccharothrix espanaensis DSM 44229]
MVIPRKLCAPADLIDRCWPDDARSLGAVLGLTKSRAHRAGTKRGQGARAARVRRPTHRAEVGRRRLRQARGVGGRVHGRGLGGCPLSEQSRWHTTALSVPITFDLAVPEVFETRRVRAAQDDVREIKLGTTSTPPMG